MKPWEKAIQGIAYALVVTFIVYVSWQLCGNVTASPYDQVVEFEQTQE
jgi:hypothetical protein